MQPILPHYSWSLELLPKDLTRLKTRRGTGFGGEPELPEQSAQAQRLTSLFNSRQISKICRRTFSTCACLG